MDLAPLLLADDHDAIGNEPRQRLLNQEKDARLEWAIVAVKNVSVIGVYEAAGSWATYSVFGVNQR